ncbi:sodium:calcium antiporter [Candidatus Micrarchaeota archaeon]|nr:sodium:calcium antiporter [Candidatus Micrarchaeota archaeon]
MIELVFFLIVFLAFLTKFSNLAIDAALVLAHKFKLSKTAAGFLMLSAATSLPELFIALNSTLLKTEGLSIGNLIGANISDLTLVLGAAVLITPTIIKKKDVIKLSRILLAVSLVPLVLLLPAPSFLKGIALLAVFAAFSHKTMQGNPIEEKPVEKTLLGEKNVLANAAIFLASIVVIIVSSFLVVAISSRLASAAGLTDAFIGATIVAIGTTLPELSVSIAALRKGEQALALGNIFGSAVVNLTLILGLIGVLGSYAIGAGTLVTLLVLMWLSCAIVWYFIDGSRKLGQREGIVLALFFLTYLFLTLQMELV